MIRGVTKNVAFAPQANKNIDPKESFVPVRIDWRNVVLTAAGNRKKRPGYAQSYDLGVDQPVDGLIPEGAYGYSVTEDGKVFQLTQTSETELTGAVLSGVNRPVFDKYDTTIMIADGGAPIKIDTAGPTTALLGGSPSDFTHIGVLGPYAIGCGHDPYEFKWAASNNVENWTTGDSGFANVKKDGIIQAFGVYSERAFFFKNQSIEIWYNRGGATPFVRIDYIEKGIGATYSLVDVNGTPFWLGNDLRFYRLQGNIPVPISFPYEDYIQSIPQPSAIYGFHFQKEHLIKWISPHDGKCLVYDYFHNSWSEDNRWAGGWQRLPINSYMEINNKQYFGSYNHDGLIYEWSKNYLDDAGQPIRVYEDFVVRASAEEGKSSRYNRVLFRLKRGVANGSVSDPVFMWRYRLDNGPWSQEEQLSLGQAGDHDPYIERNNLGIGRDMEFEISQTDAVEFLLTDMNLTARILGK